MEVLSNLALGFQTAGTLVNLMYCFIGVLLPVAARAPRLVNGLTCSSLGRSTLRRLGLVSLA